HAVLLDRTGRRNLTSHTTPREWRWEGVIRVTGRRCNSGYHGSRMPDAGWYNGFVCLAIPGQVVEIVDATNRLAKLEVACVGRNGNFGPSNPDGGGGVPP